MKWYSLKNRLFLGTYLKSSNNSHVCLFWLFVSSESFVSPYANISSVSKSDIAFLPDNTLILV